MAAAAPFELAVDDLVASLRDHGMPSARNLLVTVFGDALRPHEVSVSVASLTHILEPFAVNERLVRTSLTRLAAEDLVIATKVRHRSFYGVHPGASRLFDQANQRIYGRPDRRWDGQWTLVVIDGTEGTSASRAELRRALGWLGMGTVAPNVLASALVEPPAVLDVVEQVAHRGGVLVTRAATVCAPTVLSGVELARRSAPVDVLAERYEQLSSWIQPLQAALRTGPAPEPAPALSARVLLIALYRRAVLTDPLLPVDLLPCSWSGDDAYAVVAEVYCAIHAAAEQQLVDLCHTPAGPLRGAVERGSRFGDQLP